MRVVPDVNVLISAILRPVSPPGRILAAWRCGELDFVTSATIIAKTVEVLQRPHIYDTFSLDDGDVQGLQKLLQEEAILTPHALNLQVVEKDPEDDTIIIAAVEGRADYIISGDRHLQGLGTYQNIPILSPAEFVDQHNMVL